MEDNQDIVRFTAKELLARLDVKLDELGSKVDQKMQFIDEKVNKIDLSVQLNNEFRASQKIVNDDREQRLRSLEKKVWGAAAAAAVIGPTAAVLLQALNVS